MRLQLENSSGIGEVEFGVSSINLNFSVSGKHYLHHFGTRN